MNFSLGHIASLFKYTGISFTAGAITHGAFSGQRSMWTAITGVVLYLIGGILEKLANPSEDHSWTSVLVIGILASIGLGFFTGGLQHFPDSPGRSVWVVPVGFVMSLVAGYLMTGRGKVNVKSVIKYGAIGTLVVVLASVYAYEQLHDHAGGTDGHGHSHGQGDDHKH